MIKGTMLALALGLAVPGLAMDKPMEKAMDKPMEMDKGMGEPMAKGKAMDESPAMAPALGGHCPVGLLKMGVLKPGDPQYSVKVGDKTYQCSSAEAHAAFTKDPKGMAKKAEKAYKKMMKKMKGGSKDKMEDKMKEPKM